MNSANTHLVCTATPGGFECRISTAHATLCLCIRSHGQRNGLIFVPFNDFSTPNVQSFLRHGIPAGVEYSPPHNTSILLTRTKMYGYRLYVL
jgi:hypothetical protein